MKELLTDVDQWLAEGEPAILLATVLSTWGSSPRKVGAKMAFTPDGRTISGSVSGGCVEGAVIAAGSEVLSTRRPQVLHFGVADETAWGVGLACGGTIDVFLERLNTDVYATARKWIETGQSGSLVTIIDGPVDMAGRKIAVSGGRIVRGTLGEASMEASILDVVADKHQSGRLIVPGGLELFVDVIQPPPELVIIGGAHIAVALAQFAKIVGYHTTLIDPRRAFGNDTRFPHVDRLVQAWPDKALAEFPLRPESAVVTLSHDPKIDDPALRVALNSAALYIGALGSRKTHQRRLERLRSMGFNQDQLSRIHAPVGLDIRADTPEEIALAIMSQIVAEYRRLSNG